MPLRKAQKFQLFHPIGTQCVIGVQLVRAKARRNLMHLSLRLAFYIRIELDRSNVDARSLQVHPDKVLCFQGNGKQHPFRSLDLKSPEISRVFAFPASQSSLVSRAE